MTREVLDLHDSGYDISKVIKCIDCEQTLKEENYTPTDEDSKALLKKRFKIVIVCVLLCIITWVVSDMGQIEAIGSAIMIALWTIAYFLIRSAKVSGTDGVVKRILESDKMAGLKTSAEMYEDWMDKTNKKD
jgi:hypothetical protein